MQFYTSASPGRQPSPPAGADADRQAIPARACLGTPPSGP